MYVKSTSVKIGLLISMVPKAVRQGQFRNETVFRLSTGIIHFSILYALLLVLTTAFYYSLSQPSFLLSDDPSWWSANTLSSYDV